MRQLKINASATIHRVFGLHARTAVALLFAFVGLLAYLFFRSTSCTELGELRAREGGVIHFRPGINGSYVGGMRIQNIGLGTVNVAAIRPGCGCTDVRISNTAIPPDSEAELTFTIDAARASSGVFEWNASGGILKFKTSCDLMGISARVPNSHFDALRLRGNAWFRFAYNRATYSWEMCPMLMAKLEHRFLFSVTIPQFGFRRSLPRLRLVFGWKDPRRRAYRHFGSWSAMFGRG